MRRQGPQRVLWVWATAGGLLACQESAPVPAAGAPVAAPGPPANVAPSGGPAGGRTGAPPPPPKKRASLDLRTPVADCVEIGLTEVSDGLSPRSERVWLAALPPGKELLQVRAAWPTEHWVLRLSAGSGAQPPWNPVVIRKSLRADLGRGGIVEFDVPAASVGQETFTSDAPWFVRVESDPEQVELPAVSLTVSAAACLVDRDAQAADPQSMPFVPQGMRPGSVRWLGHDAFGYDGFQDVWAADYDSEGGTLLAFLQAGADARAATALVAAYRDWLVAAGGEASDASDIPGGVRVTLYGTHTVIFASGDLVMGVQEAPSAEAAEALGKALLAWRSGG